MYVKRIKFYCNLGLNYNKTWCVWRTLSYIMLIFYCTSWWLKSWCYCICVLIRERVMNTIYLLKLTQFFGKRQSAAQTEENCIYPRVFQTEFLFHLSHTLVCIFIIFSHQVPEPRKIVAEWLRWTDVITCDIFLSFLEIRLLS